MTKQMSFPLTEEQQKKSQLYTLNALKCFVGLQTNIESLASLHSISHAEARKRVENYVKGLSQEIPRPTQNEFEELEKHDIS